MAWELPEGLELAFSPEVPLLASPAVREQGVGRGNSQLHLGAQLALRYAVAPRIWLSAAMGGRTQNLEWSPPQPEDPRIFVEHRSLRLQLGAQYLFTDALTQPYVQGAAGLASASWSLDAGQRVAERASRGASFSLGLGVQRQLTPHLGLGAELRGFGELYSAQTITVDARDFEQPPGRLGFGLAVVLLLR